MTKLRVDECEVEEAKNCLSYGLFMDINRCVVVQLRNCCLFVYPR